MSRKNESGDPGKSGQKKKMRKDKSDASSESRTSKPLGTAKAVETLFRNAYRAELDIISLAAVKANIMISLNGIIISALMISGAFIFASSPVFLLPAGIFLLTAATSIVFALLAASPEQVDFFGAVGDWISAVRRREAGVRDLRSYVMRGRKSKARADLNLLIYEDRMHLTQEEYWSRMQALLRDRDDVYHKMSDQLYWLGQMANRKFKLLNISYTAFRWGLLCSVLAFLGVRSFLVVFPELEKSTAEPPLRNLGIAEFNNVYEPSAVQQLSDGRLLVVEDEASRAINVMTFADDGSLVENTVTNLKLMRGIGRKLSDLEGLSADEEGFIYATTSHSSDKSGQRQADREQLLRFQIKGSSTGNLSAYTRLRDVLMSADEIVRVIKEITGVTVAFDELNIEGLAYYRKEQQLLLGLRSPMAGPLSVILVIENPADVFERQATPRFGKPILLDLSGGGIRALSYDPVLETFLIVNEVKTAANDYVSQLWSWSGVPGESPLPIALPGIINLDNVESIDSIEFRGESRLLVTSDEGNARKGRPAKYLMLDYEQLKP